jgi:hypothetical protein
MTLHFPPIRKSSWAALQTGLGIWGLIEIEELKNAPPSKEDIANHRQFRRDNPQPTIEQWKRKISGS